MNNIKDHGPESKKKKWVGMIFLVIGLLLLSKQLGVFIPGWVFSWPMILILVGLAMGRKHNYQNPASYMLVIIGVVFLLDDVFVGIDFHDFLWPVLIMGIGLHLILGKKRNFRSRMQGTTLRRDEWDKRVFAEEMPSQAAETGGEPFVAEPKTAAEEAEPGSDFRQRPFDSPDDYLDTVSVFGGVKKNIVSQNFKEGDVTTIMGGVELNFIQADIKGTAILEVTQLFGGTKIIVPQQWKVASEMVAVFGGVEDKRPIIHGAVPSSEKVLIIRGTSIFGGIDIRSY